MDVHMARSGKTFAKIDETRSIHKKDMAFETCWHLSPDLGRGYLIKACLKPDLVLYVMDYDPNNAFRMAINAVPPGFGFKFFLSGAMKYNSSAVGGEMIMKKGFNRLAFFPPSKGTGKSLSRERVQVVTVSMTPSFLATLFQDDPGRLSGLKAHGRLTPFFQIGPNTSAMEAAAWDIFNCTYHGAIRRLFLECKALELVAHQFDRLVPGDRSGRISGAERDKIEYAREILVKHMDAPPSFLSLARMTGLPHNRLTHGFRSVYGTTAFSLLRDIRLDKARLLLEGKQGNVTEIAFAVGYSSLSHFAKAFKNKFGISPKQYQLYNSD